MPHAAIAVFTDKTLEVLLGQGGSGPWVGSAERVRRQEYLVCIRKAKPGSDEHGNAFLVGKISAVDEHGFDRRGQRRWFYKVSEYAVPTQNIPWHWRNPVRYTTLEDLGIDLKKLKFKPAPVPTQDLPPPEAISSAKPLTIAEAKAGLAAKFGVSPDAIDIHIKG